MAANQSHPAAIQAGHDIRIEHRYFRRGPVAIHYQTAGAGKPVVLVHGLSGSSRWWTRNILVLARHFHVHVVDLVGFGQSRGAQRFRLAEAAQHLSQWLEALGHERVSLVGHSMGGLIAAETAADFPDRVDRLVLLDAAALPLGPNYLRRAPGLVRGLWRLPFSFVPVLLADAYRSGPITLASATRQLLAADIRPKLAQVRAPTLIIWGERDTIVPLALGKQLAECLPRATFIVIPRAGHNPMWDAPAAVNRALVAFLEQDLAGEEEPA